MASPTSAATSRTVQRRGSSSIESGAKSLLSKIQVSPPYFWDFGVYERVFGTSSETREEKSASSNTGEVSAVVANNYGTVTSTSVPISEPKKPAWQSTLKEEDLTTYAVAFGETFDSIALKHDMTAVELRRVNPGVPFFSRPVPGQELRVKKIDKSSVNSEGSKADLSHNHAIKTDKQTENGHRGEALERSALLCVGTSLRIPGRLIVGIYSGFVLFEPFDSIPTASPSPATPVKMLFALDRRDILGCAAVSKITARIKADDEDSSMLLQIVWKNADLGFSAEQQVFFEISSADINILVDTIYATDGTQPEFRRHGKTLTSGVAALRVLEEQQRALAVEDFVNGSPRGVFISMGDAEDDLVLEVNMQPRESHLLSREQAVSLANALPKRLRDGTWELVYDFLDNGVSLHALFAAAKQHEETLLMIRNLDTKEVIGVFAVAPWDCAGKGGFFGSGETFVFRANVGEQDVDTFKWSGVNEFFQTCSTTHLGVGGGGNFALCIDADLLHCTSGNCMTFEGLESRPLSKTTSFKIDAIELWALSALHKPRSSTLGSASEDRLKSPRVAHGRLSSKTSDMHSSTAEDESQRLLGTNNDEAVFDDYVKL